MHRSVRQATLALAVVIAASCTGRDDAATAARSTRYEDLVSLFTEWREFQRPREIDDVPDYGADAMADQHRALAGLQRRLEAIDPSAWPVPSQVDYHIVRAEMNGLDFDHRVLRPWARDPAFYATVFPSPTDVPAREGPVALGAIELWRYAFPLSAQASAELALRLRAIPDWLRQGRVNLTGDARDLWTLGIAALHDQQSALQALGARAGADTALLSAIRVAAEASSGFASWVESQAAGKTGKSGVGRVNYEWYLRNVQLLDYSWQDAEQLLERELARAHAALALEERRNLHLPPQSLVSSAGEYDRRFNDAVTEYMQFVWARDILPVRDYMDHALRERIGAFAPPGDRPREFFAQVEYREPLVMRTHGYHWFDLARMREEPHQSPIRRGPLLYNIFASRAEGLATGMEEMMMHAGLFDGRPRARELIWILLAQRAARAIGDLMLHEGEYTFDDAVAFASRGTPRGWLPPDGATVRREQHLYLRQPGYGISYVIGKLEVERLMAERARALGTAFTLSGFFDELDRTGMIPTSLIRWELTGDGNEIRRLAAIRDRP